MADLLGIGSLCDLVNNAINKVWPDASEEDLVWESSQTFLLAAYIPGRVSDEVLEFLVRE